MHNKDGIELQWIFNVIRRWKWLTGGCALLAVIIAVIVTARAAPEYEASTMLLIKPAPDTQSSEYTTLVAGERLALTYSEILKGRSIFELVIAENKLNETPEQLAEKVTVETLSDTQLIRLTVKDSSSQQSLLLANAIANAFIEYNLTLQTERYEGALKSLEDKINTLSSKIDSIQLEISNLNKQKNENDSEKTQLEQLLVDYRSSYGLLQQSYQTLQLNANTSTGSVKIVESARVTDTNSNDLVTVTLLFERNSINIDESNYLFQTYINMLTSDAIREEAVSKLGLDLDTDLLADQVTVEAVPDTQLINLHIVGSNTAQSILLANTIANIFIEQMQVLKMEPYVESMNLLQSQIEDLRMQIEDTQSRIAALTIDSLQQGTDIENHMILLEGFQNDSFTLRQDYNDLQLTIVSAADAIVITERAAISNLVPQHRFVYIGLAGLISAALGLGASFLLEYMNDVVRTPEDVYEVLELSTLGTINLVKKPESGPVIVTNPRSPAAEAFRVLATNIQMCVLDHPLQTILVTSPSAREGKTMTVVNLSAAFAQREINVIAVDADLRMPRLAKLFGLSKDNGLTGSLLNGSVSRQLQQVDGVEGLRVLTSGPLPPNPAEVVASGRMRKLIRELTQEADLLLLDCPPVLPVADATILAALVDGVILVVHSNRTRRKDLREAVERLRKLESCLLGVVLNFIPVHSNRYYRYYH